MSLLIKNKKLLKNYNENWYKVNNAIKKGFDSEFVCYEKYLRTKMKIYKLSILHCTMQSRKNNSIMRQVFPLSFNYFKCYFTFKIAQFHIKHTSKLVNITISSFEIWSCFWKQIPTYNQSVLLFLVVLDQILHSNSRYFLQIF